jgi:hypothetical protein
MAYVQLHVGDCNSTYLPTDVHRGPDVDFILNGDSFELDAATVTARLSGRVPEHIHKHWVEVAGQRYPIMQALEAALGISRGTFKSRTARSVFQRLEFPTSTSSAPPRTPHLPTASVLPPQVSAQAAGDAFATLVAFLRSAPFTASLSGLERELVGITNDTAPDVTAAAGLTEQLLESALIVRRDVGRVSDVIHATVIALALHVILEPGETISNRPSLGPGNDKSRPFDLETDRRIAEFKVAVWSGGDMMRKRGITADLVHLAMDDSGRRPELWVAGDEPLRFLTTSASPVVNLLSRSSRHLRAKYEARYGQDLTLRDFVATHGARVQRKNLADVLPAVATALV